MSKVGVTLHNGIGDKLLDLLGSFILCKYLKYTPHYTFNNEGKFPWGSTHYDLRLFNFNNIIISNEPFGLYIHSPCPSTSLCPFRVYEMIHKVFPEITFQQISKDFIDLSKEIIQPSSLITSKIPNGIERAYGIHLRISDKVSSSADIRHENSEDEFASITQRLIKDVEQIILSEPNASFCIVSEDKDWKEVITEHIQQFSTLHHKPITFLDMAYDEDYSNYSSVLDLFCLSKCKEILQGVKYSTFSILAALLGNVKLRNYSKYTNSHSSCFIHLWSSVLEINTNKNYDIELHRRVSNQILQIHTNIPL